jgi:hypothetical protein
MVLLAAAGARAQNGSLMIADFDGETAETKQGLSLWLYSDEQFGGTSEVRAALIHPGAEGSRGALRISFHVTSDSPAPFAGAWAMVGPEGLATDLSAYRGWRFYARGRDRAAFTAWVVRFSGQLKRYMVPFEITPDWGRVELPFDRFRQVVQSGAAPAETSMLDPKDVTSVGVSVATQLRGHFDLDIDGIELYR